MANGLPARSSNRRQQPLRLNTDPEVNTFSFEIKELACENRTSPKLDLFAQR